jgi:quinol monooxygenase YgiN
MADVLTVVAKIRAATGKGDALAALLQEQAAVVRKAEPGAPHLAAYRERREKEGLTPGAPEVEIYRSLTD